MVNTAMILRRHICLQGIYVGSRAMFEEMNAAIALHRMRPVIGRVFPFHEAPAAYAYLESAQHTGKVVIRR
jgi:NADPH:quinone reductase-like Zn-dependent oxidoreductase